MPLTALWSASAVVDATDCPGNTWARLHRARPRPEITCRACGATTHAKVSSTGLHFFAHDRRVPTCPSDGETPEHRWLKRRPADAVRAAGWAAVIEAEPDASDRGGWRADVLAVGSDGRRFAFEAQLAPMTAAEGAERTARYHADGIGCAWITTKAAPWLYDLPGAQVGEATDTSPMADGRAPLLARRGLAQLPAGEDAERARNIERLYQRQRLALPTAVSDALAAARPEEGVWLGVPPTDTRRDGNISLERA